MDVSLNSHADIGHYLDKESGQFYRIHVKSHEKLDLSLLQGKLCEGKHSCLLFSLLYLHCLY